MKIVENFSLSLIRVSRKYLRNTWIHRLPITSWLYKKIFHATHGYSEREIDFRGKKFLISAKDTSMIPSIINQDYEEFELNIFKKIARPGMTILDIGANLGIYSVLGSQLIGPKGRIYAFEPVPENLALLKHNVALNNANNVKIIQQAIGEKIGKARIYLAEGSIGTHSMGLKTKNHITVATNTIDNYVKRNRLTVNLIKMDIEGFEGHALRGATQTLKDKKISLLIEFSSKMLKQSGDNPKQVAEHLMKTFKHCFIIDERKKKLLKAQSVQQVANLENSNLLLTNNLSQLEL